MPGIAHAMRRALVRREYPVVPAHIGRLDYERAEIIVGVTSRSELLSRLRPCAKEPWTVRWLEERLRDGDVLYDVGANVGAYSLIAAAIAGPGTRVFAFEPGYASYAALCDNVRLNRAEAVVVPLPILLGERTGLVTLGYRDVAPGAAEHSLDPEAPAAHRQEVLGYRLDDLVGLLGLPEPSLLKIDVDGAEAAVLAGAAQTLAGAGVRSVLVELERDGAEAAVEALGQAGLKLVDRIDRRGEEELPRILYGIFERGPGRQG
jgi:FkbM family methyltransferase